MKGWKTVAFGLFTALAPAAVTYLGGIDWTTIGISPAAAGVIGLVIIGLRAMTTSAIGRKE